MPRTDTLYVSDMDGTLLGSDSRLSEQSVTLLNELADAGAYITVATARTPATVMPLMAGVRLNLPAIVMTGAARYDLGDRRFSSVRYLEAADARTAIDTCRLHGIHPFIYVMGDDVNSLDVYHPAAEMTTAEGNFYLERRHLKFKRFHMRRTIPEEKLGRVLLLYAMGESRTITDADLAIMHGTPCSTSSYPDIFNKKISNLEIFAPGVCKATAIEQLRKELGKTRLVVFGDNLNDLPMLAIADVAVAVKNALPQVKEVAHTVIEANTTSSVVRFIAKDFGL